MQVAAEGAGRESRPVLVFVDCGGVAAGDGWAPAVLTAARAYGELVAVRAYGDWPGGNSELTALVCQGVAPVFAPVAAVQLAVDALTLCRPDSVAVLAGPLTALLPLLPALAAREVAVVLVTAETPPAARPPGVLAAVDWHTFTGLPVAVEHAAVPEAAPPSNGVSPAAPWPNGLWTAPATNGAATRSLERRIQELRRMLEQAGAPPAGELDEATCRIETGALRTLTDSIDERWGGLTADQQRLLLGMCAARIKHVQGQPAVALDEELSTRLTRLFGALTRFSKEFMPGSVHGLARAHQPRGDSWAADAREFYDHLCEQAGMVEENPAAERNRLLAELAEAVAMWSAALPEERTVPAAEVADRARACFRAGITRTDPELVRIAAPAARDLKATDFKTLRETVKQLERQPEPPALATTAATVAACIHPDCRRLAELRATPGVSLVEVEPADCDICENSNDRRAMLAMADTLHRNNLERLLVVGGSPAKRTLLEQILAEEGLQLRCVDGTGHSNTREAVNNLNWCQAAVIWGGTELDHKTSDLYTDNLPPDVLTVTLARRGIEALCREVIARVER